ncbi:phage tail protein I [Neisseria sp. S1]|uniref:phage tail protein I n=1 Tax=Neisseria sp. S1 TaxID=3318354 RepID=UPI003A878E5C
MSDYKTLLPKTRSGLEARISRSQNYPVVHAIRRLWNPDTCPAPLLPYLAWAFSVDFWNEDWTESTKRAVIKKAWRAHKYKGTIGAIEDALMPFGVSIRVIEWWQETPPAAVASFKLDLFTIDRQLTEADYKEMERIIKAVKPLSRHLSALNIGVAVSGPVNLSAVTVLGDVTTVYPYLQPILTTQSSGRIAAAVQDADILTIYPGLN